MSEPIYFPELADHVVDIRFININQSEGVFHNAHATQHGPLERIFSIVATHLRRGFYRVISLNLGGFINRKAHCVVVINTNLTPTQLKNAGFEFHGLEESSASSGVNAPPPTPRDGLEPAEDKTTWVRLDFTNIQWKSTYNVICSAMHGPVERAILSIDQHLNAGLYRLESVFAGEQWCAVCIDTLFSPEELRARGFGWHGPRVGEGVNDKDDAGPIVLPGNSRKGDF